jgi:hypothetical protein
MSVLVRAMITFSSRAQYPEVFFQICHQPPVSENHPAGQEPVKARIAEPTAKKINPSDK